MFERQKLCLIGISLISMLSFTSAYNYLMISHTGSKSHFLVGATLAKGLANAGHQVTLVSPFAIDKAHENIEQITVPNVLESIKAHNANILDNTKRPVIENYLRLMDMGFNLSSSLFEQPEVQTLLKSKRTYDAVICEVFVNEAHFGFAEHFNAPLIGLSPLGASTWNTDMVGTPSPPSFVPHALLKFSDRMSLYQRLLNMGFLTFEYFYNTFSYLPKQAAVYKANFPNNKLTFEETRRNAALVLLNNDVSLSFPRPYAPNMIEVGGMYIKRESKQLPVDIEKFINGSTHGVIFFSLGSNVRSKDLPLEKREAILSTFRKLKQRILWKFEESNLPNKPDNVYISDWFPQNDILANEKVLAFITHGGLLSITESMYHGKPIIGIPLFGDQFLNMARAEEYGYGITVKYTNLTVESFSNSIERILNDTKYKLIAQEISARFKDQKETPLERAIYWVEHVVKHKGARYLRSASQELNFIEYHNLDVILLLYGGILYVLVMCIYFLKAAWFLSYKFYKTIKKGRPTMKFKRN